MSQFNKFAAFAFAGASLALLAGSVGHGAAAPQRVDDFQLADQNYLGRHLYKLHDAKAVVLISYQANDATIKADAPAYKALKDAYASKGVEFMMDDIDSGVCHMGFFKDPDGNPLILHHRYASKE